LGSTSLIRRLFIKEVGSGSQAETLASICEMHGLKPRADRYAAAKEITYYGEADRLGEEADGSNDPQVVSQVKRILLALSVVSGVRNASRAIVFYNLARISAKDGKMDEAENYLFQARTLSAEEIDGRRRIDPLFGKVSDGATSEIAAKQAE
jgi:hypothetical protein